MSKIYDWFEERLEIQAIADDITSVWFVPEWSSLINKNEYRV